MEVLCHSDSHDLGNTDGDIDAAGKVCIQFQGIKEHPRKDVGTLVLVTVADNGIHRCQHSVSDDHFLKIPPQDPL